MNRVTLSPPKKTVALAAYKTGAHVVGYERYAEIEPIRIESTHHFVSPWQTVETTKERES